MNCVFEMGSVVPRGELYASYVDDLRHRYGALSGSVQTFTNIMRFIFQYFSCIYIYIHGWKREGSIFMLMHGTTRRKRFENCEEHLKK